MPKNCNFFLFVKSVLFLQAICKVYSTKHCYFCMVNCSFPLDIEDCSERYEDNETKCLSASAIVSGSLLVRKQCALANQTEQFCKKFTDLDSISCYSCDEDLCNASKKTSGFFSILVIFLVHCFKDV